MSKRVALALGIMWRVGYVYLDVGRMSRYRICDLKPHWETAQIGCEKIGSRKDFVFTHVHQIPICVRCGQKA